MQLNINKVINNPPSKSPHPNSSRKKENPTKELIVENEEKQEKKSHTPVIDLSKEQPKKMKILNVSQKSFNQPNTSSVLERYKQAKEKTTISPLKKGIPGLVKDASSSSVSTAKSKQSINTNQSQTFKQVEELTNVGTISEEKKVVEGGSVSKSPESNSKKGKNMSFS